MKITKETIKSIWNTISVIVNAVLAVVCTSSCVDKIPLNY